MTTIITRSKGGTGERQVDVNSILVPDLWHVAQAISTGRARDVLPRAGDSILECWSLCHDLLRHLREEEANG